MVSTIARTAAVPATYRTYQQVAFGPYADGIVLNDKVPTPTLDPSRLRVKVVSAATNPIDWKLVEHGELFLPTRPTPETPFGVGFDLAGVVVEVGADVAGTFSVGDEVYAMMKVGTNVSFAEYVTIDPRFVARKPKNLGFNHAAGIPAAGLISYQALLEHGKLKAGETVLILGGSGGTGSLAIQIAKAIGAYVITTTSTRNAEWVKNDMGADRVIDYTKEHWAEMLEPHSVDLIYDTGVEPKSWNTHAQRILKKDTGRFVTILQVPDPIKSPIGASSVSIFTRADGEDLSELTALAEAGKLTVCIDSVHPFEKLVDALAAQKSGRARGKIVLEVVAQTPDSV